MNRDGLLKRTASSRTLASSSPCSWCLKLTHVRSMLPSISSGCQVAFALGVTSLYRELHSCSTGTVVRQMLPCRLHIQIASKSGTGGAADVPNLASNSYCIMPLQGREEYLLRRIHSERHPIKNPREVADSICLCSFLVTMGVLCRSRRHDSCKEEEAT